MKTPDSTNALILVNRNANQGNAAATWKKIEREVLQQLSPQIVILEYNSPDSLESTLDEVIARNKINCLISVGGDGTLNCLLNKLMNSKMIELDNFYFGAIGLGSSNDFLKPAKRFIQGVPVRLDFKNVLKSDLGKVSFIDENGEEKTRYFIINASLGATAEANLFFNTGDRLLHFLKKKAKHLAIVYAAVKTILSFKNFKATLIVNQTKKRIFISNMGIIKNPFVSGSFRYDQPVLQDDGRLGLNYCDNMSQLELLRTLFDLARGKFSGQAKRVSCFIDSLRIETDKIVALETDGEVFQGRNFMFSLIPGAINTLGA